MPWCRRIFFSNLVFSVARSWLVAWADKAVLEGLLFDMTGVFMRARALPKVGDLAGLSMVANPVCGRGHPHGFLENPGEVLGIFEAQFVGDFTE